MAAGSSRPRADARSNRARLVAAAADLLRRHDDPAAMRMVDVARAAGVGQGTLYRHFPTRADLLLTVYRDEVQRVVADAAVREESAEAALRRWVLGLADYARIRRGLAELALPAARGGAVRAEWRPRVLAALGDLVASAQREGSVRADVGAEDVWDLLSFLWTSPAVENGERTARLVRLVLEGLRPRSCGDATP